MFCFSLVKGVREYSKPLGLDSGVKVDLVIVGSVAISREGKPYFTAYKLYRVPAASEGSCQLSYLPMQIWSQSDVSYR